jgi:hypothetical protein
MTVKLGSDAALQAASEPICPLVISTMRPARINEGNNKMQRRNLS